MPTTCPRCASLLNVSEALCTRCGWNAPYLIRRHAPREADLSYTERYRGTAFDSRPIAIAAPAVGVTRGRMFVLLCFGSLSAMALAIVLGQPPL